MLDATLAAECGLADAASALQVVHLNLTAPGTFQWVTHGLPCMRLPLLQQQRWESISIRSLHQPLGTPTPVVVDVPHGGDGGGQQPPCCCVFVYTCKKAY
jgi:hypothetical protein